MTPDLLLPLILDRLSRDLGEAAAELKVCVRAFPSNGHWLVTIWREHRPHDLCWDWRDDCPSRCFDRVCDAAVPWFAKRMGVRHEH